MIKKLLFAAAIGLTAVPQAGAWNDILNSVWGSKGNDTGGIIPWTPENERASFEIAASAMRALEQVSGGDQHPSRTRRLHRLQVRVGSAAGGRSSAAPPPHRREDREVTSGLTRHFDRVAVAAARRQAIVGSPRVDHGVG